MAHGSGGIYRKAAAGMYAGDRMWMGRLLRHRKETHIGPFQRGPIPGTPAFDRCPVNPCRGRVFLVILHAGCRSRLCHRLRQRPYQHSDRRASTGPDRATRRRHTIRTRHVRAIFAFLRIHTEKETVIQFLGMSNAMAAAPAPNRGAVRSQFRSRMVNRALSRT